MFAALSRRSGALRDPLAGISTASVRARCMIVLGVASLVLLAARLVVIGSLPDANVDAYGHFAIARALSNGNTSLAVHWVWLPGWHYALWAMQVFGLGFSGARAVGACVQGLAPFLLYDLIDRGRYGDERVAFWAALAFALAPLPNALATSGQSETVFCALLLGAASALARERPGLGGALLAMASLIRYEAWGAVTALAAAGAFTVVSQRTRRSLARLGWSVLPSLVAIGIWVALRARADGKWFAFIEDTRRFASGIRATELGTGSLGPIADIARYVLLPPLETLGIALLLVPFGLTSWWRRSTSGAAWIALGVFAFLAIATLCGATLGLDRYFVSLAPYACAIAAYGAARLEARARLRRLRLSRAISPAFAVCCTLALVVGSGLFLHKTRVRFADRIRASTTLQKLASTGCIACSDTVLQLSSGLSEDRFCRLDRALGAFDDPRSADAPLWIYGWESELGPLREAGESVLRLPQAGSSRADALVIRVIRARANASSATTGR